MQLALVIENAPEPDMSAKLIPEIAYRPLREIVQLPLVARHLPQLLERHRKSVDVFRECATFRDGGDIFRFQRSGNGRLQQVHSLLPVSGSVLHRGVTASPVRSKVSVGTNPWRESPRPVNLASLCEKYGGGGHAKVAAISLSPDDSTALARSLSTSPCFSAAPDVLRNPTGEAGDEISLVALPGGLRATAGYASLKY